MAHIGDSARFFLWRGGRATALALAAVFLLLTAALLSFSANILCKFPDLATLSAGGAWLALVGSEATKNLPFSLFLVFILFLGLEAFDFITAIGTKCEEYEPNYEKYEPNYEKYEPLSTGKPSLLREP